MRRLDMNKRQNTIAANVIQDWLNERNEHNTITPDVIEEIKAIQAILKKRSI